MCEKWNTASSDLSPTPFQSDDAFYWLANKKMWITQSFLRERFRWKHCSVFYRFAPVFSVTFSFRMKERNALLLLLLTAFIWGMSFVAQSVSSDTVGTFTFNSTRFMLGTIVLIPFSIPRYMKYRTDKAYISSLLKGGFFCGLCLALACIVQQMGIAYSGAGKAGFHISRNCIPEAGRRIIKWIQATYSHCLYQGLFPCCGTLVPER